MNVFGAAAVADSLLPLLKKSKSEGGGRILNISSGLGSIATMADPNGQYKGVYVYVRPWPLFLSPAWPTDVHVLRPGVQLQQIRAEFGHCHARHAEP